MTGRNFIKAIRAVLDGQTQTQVAETFGVARGTVSRWLKIYREKGEEGLLAKPRGRPKGGKLLGWQAATICNIIRDRCPDQLKLPFALWTREAVQQLIEKKFGIKLSIWTVGRYLRRWNFTPQKPLKRAYERNPQVRRVIVSKPYSKMGKFLYMVREIVTNYLTSQISYSVYSLLASSTFFDRRYNIKETYCQTKILTAYKNIITEKICPVLYLLNILKKNRISSKNVSFCSFSQKKFKIFCRNSFTWSQKFKFFKG